MKILLVGEFSGVHTNFKNGLELLGHSVVLMHDGDGFKNLNSDVALAPYRNSRLLFFLDLMHFWKHRMLFKGNDIVCFLHSSSVPFYCQVMGLMRYVRSNNRTLVYYACGTDTSFLKSHDLFEYFPFSAIEAQRLLQKRGRWYRKYYEKKFFDKIDFIIPSCYNYALGYTDSEKLKQSIPFPSKKINNSALLEVSQKRRILFGITRKSFKGESYIRVALNKLRQTHKDLVEVKFVERLSFEEYMNELIDTDILVDQCRSYDYGMNALLGMENSAIVLSGAEPIALDYAGLKKCPIINIQPNSESIYNVLVNLVEKTDEEIMFLKESSWEFVRSRHDSIEVAKKFLGVIYND